MTQRPASTIAPQGWFSRRHPTDAEHTAAVNRFKVRKAAKAKREAQAHAVLVQRQDEKAAEAKAEQATRTKAQQLAKQFEKKNARAQRRKAKK